MPGDCDDTRSAVNPEAVEICDGEDNDCDGTVDDTDATIELPTWYLDQDGDGAGIDTQTVEACDAPDGYAAVGGDCDDTDPTQLGSLIWYLDDDGDGRGVDSVTLIQCVQPVGFAGAGGDCDDTDPLISPVGLEICDGIDNDCDGDVDDDDPQGAAGATPWFADTDTDGFGDRDTFVVACLPPTGFTADSSDCDDSTSSINPAIPEVCDGVDQNCNRVADDGAPGDLLSFRDLDGDGFGSDALPVTWCSFSGAPVDVVDQGGDCDEEDADVNPSVDEVCDGIDNDCNGFADDSPVDGQTFKADRDGDGNPADEDLEACSPGFDLGLGFALFVDPGADYDCDDADPDVFFGAPELCDGIDNDCIAGGTDTNPSPGEVIAFVDADGDSLGDPLQPVEICLAVIPTGLSLNNNDCNDADPRVFSPTQTLITGEGLLFTSVQDAVDASCEGQEIQLAPGTFSESVLVDHPIRLVGSDLAPSRIEGDPALRFVNVAGEFTTLDQLTLVSTDTAALEVVNSRVTATRVELETFDGVGLHAAGSASVDLSAGGLVGGNAAGFFNQVGGTAVEAVDDAVVEVSFTTMIGFDMGFVGSGNASIAVLELEADRPGALAVARDDAFVSVEEGEILEGGPTIHSDAEGTAHASQNGVVELTGIHMRSSLGRMAYVEDAGMVRMDRMELAGGSTAFGGTGGGMDITYSTIASRFGGNFPLFRFDPGATVTGTVQHSILIDQSIPGFSNANPSDLVFDHNFYGAGRVGPLEYGGTHIVGEPDFWRRASNCSSRSWDLHLRHSSDAAGDPFAADEYGFTASPEASQFDREWNLVESFFNGQQNTMERGWSLMFFGVTTTFATDDADGDGLDNVGEMLLGTDPTERNTDGDALDDLEESTGVACAY